MFKMNTLQNSIIFKTNFKKVMEFNRAFDMVPMEPSDYSGYTEDSLGNIQINPFANIRKSIFQDSPATIRLRLDLIKEELGELEDAIKQNDIIEQRYACADILYVVYGMADVLGISIDDIFSCNIKEKAIYYHNEQKHNGNGNGDVFHNKILVASNNCSSIITNFNYMKTFSTEFLDFDISSKTVSYMVDLIINKLNTIYNDLEFECLDNDTNTNNDTINDTILEKFIIIANYIYQLLSWTYIMTLTIRINADDDFDIVHSSNMSKLCSTEADAIDTVADYQDKYKAGKSPYDSPYYYYLENLDKWIVKNLSSGKALKNIKYKKVCFTNPRFVF